MLKKVDYSSHSSDMVPVNRPSYCDKVFLITIVALAIVGILALLKVGALSAVAAQWYYFELPAAVFFVLCVIGYLKKALLKPSPEQPLQVE